MTLWVPWVWTKSEIPKGSAFRRWKKSESKTAKSFRAVLQETVREIA